MTTWFADTAYYLALINPADDAHATPNAHTEHFAGKIVTTTSVLNEIGNHLSHPSNRPLFGQIVDRVASDPDIRLIYVDRPLFDDAIDLYRKRPDQSWSLTDCISFLVMKKLGLTEALTTDRHFVQAGYRALPQPGAS
jgi:predicted nucleic acid-binding protein